MDKNHSFFTIITLAKISVKRYFRDRLAIFFTVMFPLIFLFIFGGLFGKNTSTTFHIGLINESSSKYASQVASGIKSQTSLYKIDASVTNLDQAKAKMSRSEIDATIDLPSDFGVVKGNQKYPSGQAIIYYDQNNAQAAQTLQSILQGQLDATNQKLVASVKPFKVSAQSTNTSGLSRFDYTFSGLLGFSILGLGIFGPINYFPEMKKQGILRRLHITPLKVWEYFVSSVLSNAVIGLFSIAIMFAVAASPMFHFHMAGNFFELAIFIIYGILCIFGIGLALGGWAKNERQAAPLGNLVSFPMMFLSGTFFPRYLMPEWLQHITNYLPLTPVIDGIRLIATEGKSLFDIGPQLLYIAIWTIIIYFIAFRVFRWE